MSAISLVIVGAGGHGRELASYVREVAEVDPGITLVGFVDDRPPAGPVHGVRILGTFSDLEALLHANPSVAYSYLTAVGDNPTRRRLVERLGRLGAHNLTPWSLVHPRAAVGQGVEVGPGSCLAPGCILTTDVRIGAHCVLNVNVSVSHDCVVGDFSNVNPGAALCGGVRLGTGCCIGAGATVIQNVSIGENVTVGAGAVVIRDLPDGVCAVGVPSRLISR